MTTSPYKTTQYPSTHFVESAGCVLIHKTNHTICLLNHKRTLTRTTDRINTTSEYLLPKGRRNISETRPQAALREVKEETGYSCSLLPITLQTRAPPAIEIEQAGDEVREYEGVYEPFMVTLRQLDEVNVKFIWWFLAQVDEGVETGEGEERFGVEFFEFDEAREKLTFVEDRGILDRAVEIFTRTYG